MRKWVLAEAIVVIVSRCVYMEPSRRTPYAHLTLIQRSMSITSQQQWKKHAFKTKDGGPFVKGGVWGRAGVCECAVPTGPVPRLSQISFSEPK